MFKPSKPLSGCLGCVAGVVLGLILSVALAAIDLIGVELAGTQIVLYPIYAVAGIIIGAAAGAIGGWLLGTKPLPIAFVGWLGIVAIAFLLFFGYRSFFVPF